MEHWQTLYMHKLATIPSSKGMGPSARDRVWDGHCSNKIQSQDTTEHVIIEYNDGAFVRLEDWAEGAKHAVTPLKGMWEDVVPTLPDSSFNGILYDTYPLSEEDWHTHQFRFMLFDH